MFTFFRRLRARLKYRHFERDIAREIDIHRAMKQEELEATGVAGTEARSRAARALGNTTLMREDSRSIWIARWIEQTMQDVRYALVAFRRQPGFCISVIAIVGVGLGLVTTAYAVVDATYFRPWQVPNGSQVYLVRSTAERGSDFGQMSFPELRFLQTHVKALDYIGATIRTNARVYYRDDSHEDAYALDVSGNYFDLLGVRMAAGRTFLPEEDNYSTHVPVAVISERIWTERFQRDPSVIGRVVRINRESHTIVGVAPSSFLDPHDSHTGVWRPLTVRLTATPEDARSYADPRHRTFSYAIVAKLKEGAAAEQATAEISGLSRRFREAAGLPPSGHTLRDTRPSSGGGDLQVAWVILGALVLIQLVACANVGNLVLARSISRQREMAVRLSLGAGRGRLVRQLVTEVMVLSVCAAVLDIGLAFLIPSVATPFLPRAVVSGIRTDELTTQVVVGLAPDLPSAQINRIDAVVYTPPSGFIIDVIVRGQDPRIGDRFNEVVSRFDPGMTVSARPLEDGIRDVLLPARIGSWVAWTIGGIGLVLAMIGAFGVFAHAVEARRREIGIRLALGAESAQVIRLVVARTQGSAAVGVACGLALAIGGATFARGFLYGLSPFDPIAYLQVAGILAVAAAVATWIPARRATRVHPAVTLRAE